MGTTVEFFTPLHTQTSRDYVARMVDHKVDCMRVAKQYGADYWDGDRRYGYGGYRYDGRWRAVAERIAAHYGLKPGARILDVGCGKAHLLYELSQVVPGSTCVGFDISRHGLDDAPAGIRPSLFLHRAEEPYPFADREFDLVLSLGCLHNLRLPQLAAALSEIERVGRDKFVMVESFRNEQELFNLQCWALTCETFLDRDTWVWFYNQSGYTGDYEFIYFT